MVPSSQL
ncbi:hypothetical protein D030_1563, partial [Vibrio parahaemolyticus AQ3810]